MNVKFNLSMWNNLAMYIAPNKKESLTKIVKEERKKYRGRVTSTVRTEKNKIKDIWDF